MAGGPAAYSWAVVGEVLPEQALIVFKEKAWLRLF